MDSPNSRRRCLETFCGRDACRIARRKAAVEGLSIAGPVNDSTRGDDKQKKDSHEMVRRKEVLVDGSFIGHTRCLDMTLSPPCLPHTPAMPIRRSRQSPSPNTPETSYHRYIYEDFLEISIKKSQVSGTWQHTSAPSRPFIS